MYLLLTFIRIMYKVTNVNTLNHTYIGRTMENKIICEEIIQRVENLFEYLVKKAQISENNLHNAFNNPLLDKNSRNYIATLLLRETNFLYDILQKLDYDHYFRFLTHSSYELISTWNKRHEDYQKKIKEQ
jgi:hypothetical protein